MLVDTYRSDWADFDASHVDRIHRLIGKKLIA